MQEQQTIIGLLISSGKPKKKFLIGSKILPSSETVLSPKQRQEISNMSLKNPTIRLLLKLML